MRDARNKANDSHIYNHWQSEHAGRETEFQFQIVKFFNSPLERQVSEAVRIERTGAHKILNTKGVYNRSSIPKLVALDSKEEKTIGDTGKTIEETRGGGQSEYILTGIALEKNQRKQRRKEKLKDNINWGRKPKHAPENTPTEDSGEEDEEEILDPVKCLEMFLTVLEEKDITPHTSTLAGHSPIPVRREAKNITLVSPGKAPPSQLPQSSPAGKIRSCPRAILESSARGQWLVRGGGHMWESSCS